MKKLTFHLALSLTAVALVVACGKKKDDSGYTKRPRGQSAEAPRDRGGNPATENEIPAPGSDSTPAGDQQANTPPMTLPTTPADDTAGAGGADASGTQADQGEEQTQDQGAPGQVTIVDVAPKGTSSSNDLGIMSNEAAKYSGSADDYLRNLLMLRANQVQDAGQKKLNLEAANSIKSASLLVDYVTAQSDGNGETSLTLTIEAKGSQPQQVLLSGKIRNGKTNLRTRRANVSGKLTCMDQDSRFCENALVELEIGTTQKASVAMILRRTSVTLSGQFLAQQCRVQGCEDFYSVLRHTELRMTDRWAINSAKLISFEVINGRSEFKLVARTYGREVIVIGGQLINPAIHPITNLIADRVVSIEDQVDSENGVNYRTNIHNALKDVRIVQNDGRGTVKLKVTFKEVSAGVEDSMELTLKRIGRELRPIVQ